MKKILARTGPGVLIAFLLLYGFVWVRSRIPAQVHDAELQLARASIPAGSNAFDVLQAAGKAVWWPGQKSAELSKLARDTNWDDNLANTVVANNRTVLAAWDAAANLPDFHVPEATRFDDQFVYLPTWKYMAQIATVRENLLLHQGHDKEAFDLIMSDLQMSRRMQDGHGALICYLVAVAVSAIGLGEIQHWAGKTHLDAAQLKEYIRQLTVDPNDEGVAFANTIRAEYRCEVGNLEALRDGKITGAPSRLLPTFNFSETKAQFADISLLLVNAAPHHYNGTTLPDMKFNRPGLVSLAFSGNMAGELMCEMASSGLVPSLAKKSQVDTAFQATRVILALRAYQLTHGNLPPDLASLVPEFLDQVPVDDFDGQPLRYSPDRKIVYSVGKNLKDDGGDDSRGKPLHAPLDLVYRFDF